MSANPSAKYERFLLAIEPPVVKITLNHPPLNVIDIAMMEELKSVLTEIESQPAISVVIFGGSGKSFTSGVDVAAHTVDRVQSMLQKFHNVIKLLIATKKVTIAAVHGNCLGGGAELAMVCDLVYTAEDALWAFPEIQLGCFPPVAATALSALVGQKWASELILTGRTITGAEAATIGLANRAVARDQLSAVVDETVRRLSGLSSMAVAIAKKANYAWDSMHFDKGLARAEKIYLEELMKTEDAEEGIRAFLEKRTPQWKGH
jgi:cyclohexa-1,5-dienecarbonyl-CoA hydratase